MAASTSWLPRPSCCRTSLQRPASQYRWVPTWAILKRYWAGGRPALLMQAGIDRSICQVYGTRCLTKLRFHSHQITKKIRAAGAALGKRTDRAGVSEIICFSLKALALSTFNQQRGLRMACVSVLDHHRQLHMTVRYGHTRTGGSERVCRFRLKTPWRAGFSRFI